MWTDQLRVLRVEKGFSQAELARRSGLARPNLIDLELGRRDCNVQTLLKLSKALGVKAADLLREGPSGLEAASAGRYEEDAIARYLVTGKGRLTQGQKDLAEAIQPLIRSLLEASGVPCQLRKNRSVRQVRYHLQSVYSPEVIQSIIKRIRKWLTVTPSARGI